MSSLSSAMVLEPGLLAGLYNSPAKTAGEPGLARDIQNTLVPSIAHKDMHIEAYGQTIPMDDAGGDLLDLVAAGRDIIACVADVSGHGLRAAVLMGMIKTLLRYGLHLNQPLAALLDSMNLVLPGVKERNMYATLAALRFDGSHEIEYISAGHVPLLHYRRRQRDIVRYALPQFPLGLFDGVRYATRRVRYEAGDIFALLTDGVVEAGADRQAEFGLERLEQILCELAPRPLSEIFEAVQMALSEHGTQQDDRTILFVRALTPERPACTGHYTA